MTIPLQFASLYDRRDIFVWSNCLLDLGTVFLIGNMETSLSHTVRFDKLTVCPVICSTNSRVSQPTMKLCCTEREGLCDVLYKIYASVCGESFISKLI